MTSVSCDQDGSTIQVVSDEIQPGIIERVPSGSANVSVFRTRMREGLYGQTRLDVFPYRIITNKDVLLPRERIALVHEMLHVWAELHKMPEFHTKYHNVLHDLAVFVFKEVLPVLNKFDEHTAKENNHVSDRSDPQQDGPSDRDRPNHGPAQGHRSGAVCAPFQVR